MNINKINLPDFWQFSLTLYKNELVQSTLIYFQNEFNANVNLALLCAMLNKHKINLTQQQLLNLHNAVSEFSAQFTKPLRSLRQDYKNKMDVIESYQAIRQKLLDAELVFEQQEQSLLITAFNQLKNEYNEQTTTDNLVLYQTLLIKKPKHKQQATAQLSDLNQCLV